MQVMSAFRGVEDEFIVEGPLVKTHPSHDPVTRIAATSLVGSVRREGVRLCGSGNSRSPYKIRPPAGCGKTHYACHSEERSDEESLFLLAFFKERFLASLGITEPGAFFRSLLELLERDSLRLFS